MLSFDRKSSITAYVGAESPEIDSSLRIAFAPYCSASLAYSVESVDTYTCLNNSDSNAASIVYAIIGLPHMGSTFLFFSPFDPERAGIRAVLL